MLKLGIVQMSVQEGDVEKNCRHMEELVQKYASDDIDLLCFPELCISGYDFDKAAQSEQEDVFVSGLAQKYRIPIFAGINKKEGQTHYDVAAIWDESGKLLGEYKKIHLWDKENDFFATGDQLVSVMLKGWNIGLLICADLGFSELSKALAMKRDVDVIIYPSAWNPGWEYLYSNLSSIRSAENQIYTVGLDRASGDVKYCGYTTVSNPDGTILEQLSTPEEAYAKVVLYKEKLKEARASIPWRLMRREDIYRCFW